MVRKDEKIAHEGREACEKWRQWFKYNIDEYHRLMNFVLGRQWTDDEEDMLKTFKKVPLQFNKLSTLINTLLGEQQQNTPQIEVVPLSNCDEETAALREMLVKDIMLGQDAKTVYQVAAHQAFTAGFGAFLWDTDYVNESSFDVSPIPRYFRDASLCYWDVGAEHINKIDSLHAGYTSNLTWKRFKQEFGKEAYRKVREDYKIVPTHEEIALATDPAEADDAFSWASAEGCTVNHFYKRKYRKDTLYKLSNGVIVNQEQMDNLVERSQAITQQMQMQQSMLSGFTGMEMPMQGLQNQEMGMSKPPEEMMPSPAQGLEEQAVGMPQIDENFITLYYEGEPVRIEDSRRIKRSIIMHYVIAGDYILAENECPCDDIPLIFVDQNSFYEKNGKQVCRSFIIDAVDAQRYINYLATQSAYVLKITRFDQFIGPKGNARSLDTQRTWRDPYSVQGMLLYDEVPSGAKPEQLRTPEISQSFLSQYQRATEDLYTSTGMYPSRLGQQGNEVSGAAIDARTRQGSYPTYVAFNSINRAITAGGTILNQMIPRVYDSERVVTLMSPDEGRKNITLNKALDPYGEKIENDIRQGEFEVRLVAGPSYEGQKKEALDSINMILQANPQLFNLFGDLYAENLPLVNTLQFKNRLKTIVPPEIIEIGKTGKPPQNQGPKEPSPEEKAIEADIQFKQAQIELKKQELALKERQQQIDLQIEMQKLQAEELEIAGEIKEQELRFMAENKRTDTDAAISQADNLIKLLTHHGRQTERGRKL